MRDDIGFVTDWHSGRRIASIHLSGHVTLQLHVTDSLSYIRPRDASGFPLLRRGDVVGTTGTINLRLHQLVAGGSVRVYQVANTAR